MPAAAYWGVVDEVRSRLELCIADNGYTYDVSSVVLQVPGAEVAYVPGTVVLHVAGGQRSEAGTLGGVQLDSWTLALQVSAVVGTAGVEADFELATALRDLVVSMELARTESLWDSARLVRFEHVVPGDGSEWVLVFEVEFVLLMGEADPSVSR